MPGFVEERLRRVAIVSKLVKKGLEEKGKVDYEQLVYEIQFQTGVTDKKAREYLQIIIRKFNYETEMEETKYGRIYWIKPRRV